jgi:hypothetical protein
MVGKFRMTRVELHELWQFTTLSLQHLLKTLHRELSEITELSLWANELRPILQQLLINLWKLPNADDKIDLNLVSPNDVTIASTWLLSSLLGGDIMLQTLEELDESMILIPRDFFDDHLLFF